MQGFNTGQTMSNLKIVYKPITDLIPYANNSRTHSDDQVLQIASSIKEFGFTNPVLVDDEGGIVAGHGRVMAAKKLNLKEVPTITLIGLTEAQKKAYIIADNKLALNASWDDEMLKLEFEALKELDFDLEMTGFDISELNFNTANYDVLDDENLDKELDEMASGVKKALQIEFEPEDYQEAQELVKFWRSQGAYVGYMLIQYLQSEKNKL
jgi:ParB family transcriptional regulator, chromosome partitioning protein